MIKQLLPFLFCFLMGMTFIGTQETNAQVNFYLGTLDDMRRSASTQDKYSILYFEADWCAPCKRMQKDVFTDMKVGNLVKKKFLFKKINGEAKPYIDLVQELEVQNYPTTLIFNQNGREVARLVGYYDKDDFMNELKAFIPNSRRTIYSEFR